jgi:hypothetical protein
MAALKIPLETVVITILPRPDINRRTVHLLAEIHGFFDGVNRFPAHRRIPGSERALPPDFLRKEIGNDGRTRQPIVRQDPPHLACVFRRDIPIFHQFNRRYAWNGGRLPHHLQLGRLILVTGRKESVARVSEVSENYGIFHLASFQGLISVEYSSLSRGIRKEKKTPEDHPRGGLLQASWNRVNPVLDLIAK